MTGFVHLRVHTEYSLVDSVVRVDPLVDALDKLGMPACAITDQGNVSALVKFYRAAFDRGIKPLIGADVWVAESADDREPTSAHAAVPEPSGFKRLSALLTRSAARGPVAGRNVVLKEWLDVERARRPDRALGRASRRARSRARGGPRRARARGPRLLAHAAAAALLCRASTARAAGRKRVSRPRRRACRGARRARGRDERRVLPRARRLRGARDARLHRPGRDARRSVASAPVLRGAVPEVRAGDGRAVRRLARGAREHGRDREALQPRARPRPRVPARLRRGRRQRAARVPEEPRGARARRAVAPARHRGRATSRATASGSRASSRSS